APVGRGTHEGGRLTDEAVAFEHGGIPGECRVAIDGVAILVDPPAFSVNHVDIRVGVQVGGGGTDGTGKERVVGIQPDEDFAAGMEKTTISSVGGTLVLAGEAADAIAVGGQNPGGFVGRSSVHYDDLQIRVVLGEDALDSFAEVSRHIVGRRNDGYEGRGGGIHGHTHYINPDTEGRLL